MARRRRSALRGDSPFKDFLLLLLIVVVAWQGYLLWGRKDRSSAPTAGGVRKQTVAVQPRTRPVQPSPKSPPVAAVRSSARQGRIAVILDDAGYNLSDCDQLAALPAPMTISILPKLAHSREISACAHRYGQEVMLHLPMEPHINKDHYPDDYIIKGTMPASLVTAKIDEALASVPHADGVNNHMGSKATEDKRLMALVLAYLERRGLFFVDSRVTAASVCAPLARQKHIPFTERDIFLDNKNERAYIEGQFAQAAAEAREKGYAVAIGHTRSMTWAVLRDEMRRLSAEGFEFVPVSRIIADGH